MSDGFVLKTSKSQPAPKSTGVKDAQLPNADDGYVKTKWRQERIWIESVEREAKSIKEWEANWSFLGDYDQKGNLKEKEKLPNKVNMFSDILPSTAGHIYGNRLNTDEAIQIKNMEKKMGAPFRKRKNKELICYD